MIEIFNQKQFRETEPEDGFAVISIQTPRTIHEKWIQSGTEFDVDPGWKDVLVLKFHDVLESDGAYIAFNEEMANQVVQFVETHKEGHFVIHCDAGWSRSVAVGLFVNDYAGDGSFFDFNLHAAPDVSKYNSTVLRELRRVVNRRLYGNEVEY